MTSSDRRPEPPSSRRAPDAATRRLVLGAQRGDAASFHALYERVAPALHAWACLRIRPALRARLEPEDLVQEVWVRALGAFARYDPERGAFRPWLFQVAKYVLLDAMRRLRPDAAAGGPASGGWHLSDVPDEATSVSRKVARLDGMARFVDRVAALPAEDRTLLVHRGLEGLSARDVATRLGISPAAAEKRWQRLRERFARRPVPEGLLE